MSFEKLTAYLDSLEGEFGIPACDCLVMRDHETVYRHSAGYADSARTRPVAPGDLYFIYSASKVITCAAVMQLVEQGKLGLEDLLEQYLPEFAQMEVLEKMPEMFWRGIPEDIGKVSIRPEIRIIDLLTMTAGLSYDTGSKPIRELRESTGGRAGTREMMRAIARMPLLCKPRSRWLYSLAHDVLAAVVEVVSGKRFSDYLRTAIFEPLGIEDMSFDLPEAETGRLSTLYTADMVTKKIREIEKVNTFRLTDAYESGGAGIICSVDAYAKFADAMACGGVGATGRRILSPESIDCMRRNYLTGELLEDFKRGGKRGYGYGLGVRSLIDRSESRSPLGEFGWDGAAGAYVLLDTENRLSIFYIQHILMFPDVYFRIHPAVRDLTYEALDIG